MSDQKFSSTIPFEIQKYFKKYASKNWTVEINEKKLFELILVIPVINEFENIEPLLKSLYKNNKTYLSKTLILFVINNLKSSFQKVKEDNSMTINFLRRVEFEGMHIGIIDSATAGKELPEKEGGVGLARKIGMDFALEYFNYSSSRKNILGCLDADCIVSENYIEEIIDNFNNKNISAAHVNFMHPVSGNDDEKAAIICYEIFLRHYVWSLKLAGSHYGFFTIGSTMFCDSESYIKVQGMNKRKAAEDFYFMEKLAKISNIETINSAVVFPSGRKSWRVPFGTGQRVNRFLEGTHDEHYLYSPKSFSVLKDWLSVFMGEQTLSAEEYLDESKKINESLYIFLENNFFERSWNKILNGSHSSRQINKQKIIWFDGFRTLKLIHYLRDCVFPNEPMFAVLDEMFFQEKLNIITGQFVDKLPPIDTRLKYLECLRKLT